jgi:hypothetical protein
MGDTRLKRIRVAEDPIDFGASSSIAERVADGMPTLTGFLKLHEREANRQ